MSKDKFEWDDDAVKAFAIKVFGEWDDNADWLSTYNSEHLNDAPTSLGMMSKGSVEAAMDKFADIKLDHAILFIQEAWLGIDGDVMFKGKYTNEVFLSIINKVKGLKSKQSQDPIPPSELPPLK